jgi:hypothetical protein
MSAPQFWPHFCPGTGRVEWTAQSEPCNWCDERAAFRCDEPGPVEPEVAE